QAPIMPFREFRGPTKSLIDDALGSFAVASLETSPKGVHPTGAHDDAGVDVDPVTPLEAAFSGMPWSWPPALRTDWRDWLQRWLAALGEEGDLQGAAAQMRLASPKYVPREGILIEAYSAAERGDSAPLRSLQELFRRPYDEQPLWEDQYFKRREDVTGAVRGGVDFMS
ncbi:unnamed protein product, partial [Prorocentrum cordatum]